MPEPKPGARGVRLPAPTREASGGLIFRRSSFRAPRKHQASLVFASRAMWALLDQLPVEAKPQAEAIGSITEASRMGVLTGRDWATRLRRRFRVLAPLIAGIEYPPPVPA